MFSYAGLDWNGIFYFNSSTGIQRVRECQCGICGEIVAEVLKVYSLFLLIEKNTSGFLLFCKDGLHFSSSNDSKP